MLSGSRGAGSIATPQNDDATSGPDLANIFRWSRRRLPPSRNHQRGSSRSGSGADDGGAISRLTDPRRRRDRECLKSVPFYIVTRADHERQGGLRTERDRPGDVALSLSNAPRASSLSQRILPRLCTRSARSTTGSVSPLSGSTTSSRTSGSRVFVWLTYGVTQ